jgi:hypothetical protein
MREDETAKIDDLYSGCYTSIDHIMYGVMFNYEWLIEDSKKLYKHDNVATTEDILNEVSRRLFFKNVYHDISTTEELMKMYEDMINRHKANLEELKQTLHDSKLKLKLAKKMCVVPALDDVVNTIVKDIDLKWVCSIIYEDKVIENRDDERFSFTKQEVIEAIKKSDIDKFKSLNFEEICKILYLFKMNKEDIGNSKKKWLLDRAVSKYNFIMIRRHQGKEYKDNDKLDEEENIMKNELQELSAVSKTSAKKLYEKFDSIRTLAVLQGC